ncbi:transporter substrate-binding domain-containing protein [Desulfosarcina alkanivorans]|nr:transporter substrate-binding domain-containing protein [Desulfosarcina alkanivorans]
MRMWLSTCLLACLVVHPMGLPAADTSAAPVIARGDRHFPPYEFLNADGQPDGFNVDLLKAISARLEMNVDIGLDAWETVLEDLASGDIQLATGMIRSAQRENTFEFSISHAGVFYCLFVRRGSPIKSIEDAGGKAILVHARAYSHDWLQARRITDRIMPVSSPRKALQLLAEGRHDAAIIERLSALDLMRELGIDTIVMAGPPLVCAPYAFAVRKGDDRLLAKLNEGIHLMHQSGVYEDLYRKWFSVADAHARRMAMVRSGLFVLAAMAGVAAAIFVWNLLLKKTVRRRTAALMQSERRFHELCDLLPQTVFETDSSGRLSFLNRSGFDMMGLDPQSISDGIHLSDLLPGETDFHAWALDGHLGGKACVVSGPDKDPFPALFYATPVLSGGRHAGLRGLLVDITFQKELENQVLASQKMEALGQLAGGVAHDFSNIVTGISAYAQLIARRPQDADAVANSAEKILTGCDRGTDLVRHFLATAGRRKPERQRVRLGRVVSEVFNLIQPTCGPAVAFDNAVGGEDDAVWAEPALVFQVLMNLCVNSAQAMAGSGGTLTVGLMADPSNGQTSSAGPLQRVLYVADTGPGIDPDLKDRIFEPFFTTRGKTSGTGIGLFVVGQALSDMGGDIRVESEPGKGATFIVILPAAPSPGNGVDAKEAT